MATTVVHLFPDTKPVPTQRWLGLWLIVVAIFIALMVVVGGATRLTESGLSIVHWKPFAGMIPPLGSGDWSREFAAYQHSPQYLRVNAGMSLEAFKPIFWWEWGHRELGRVLFLVFLLPLIFFGVRTPKLIAPWLMRFAGIFAIGCLQPLIGWLMVRSGLQNDPHVSHYWLTLHLLTALLLFAAIVWTAFDIMAPKSGRVRTSLRILLGLLTLQIALGGFVAGLRAGFAFNTWPLMGEGFVPPDMWSLMPWWQNMLTNPITVQFMHRITAYLVFCYGVIIVYHAVKHVDAAVRRYGMMVGAALVVQVMLGIATLMSGVPVWLGTAHQAGAVLVLASVIAFLHQHREPLFKN